MQHRTLGKTGWSVSTVSFGAWAIGGAWGAVSDDDSLAALRRAVELGVNFIDTADVYGDGRSERLVAQVARENPGQLLIATKAGRRLPEQTVAGYSRENLTAFIDRSLTNLGVEALDLLQLHCPPTDAYYHPELFDLMDGFVAAGKVRHYGVSVERVEEALHALDYPGVATVQIIFNLFRQRPAELFLGLAQRANVGVLARVPLASGMLTGKLRPDSTFAEDDHRRFNRHGERFDVGETFSGVDYATGLQAVDRLRPLCPPGVSLAQFALRWILMHEAVTCVIPGAKTPEQAEHNALAADLPPLSDDALRGARAVYDSLIRPQVHGRW